MPTRSVRESKLFVATFLAGITATLCFGRTAPGSDFNVLMIGNSYVQGNSSARAVSLDVQGLFDADPAHTGTVTKRAESSWSLKTHAESSITTDLITNSATYQWDAIVLQEQSNRPGRAIKFMDSQLTNLDLGGPVLIDLIKQHQPQAAVVLYNSWSKFPGQQDLIDYFDNDVDEMLSYTNQGYDRIQKNPGEWDNSDIATIARVGDAWGEWYDTYGFGNSSMRLHDADGTHQNDRGSYLAASVIYETITGSSTIGNTYSGAVTGSVGGASKLLLLQQQASATTGAANTGDFDQDGDVDGADFLKWQLGDTPGLGSSNELALWQSQFGKTLPMIAATTEVPEPGTLLLMLSLFAFQVRSRRF
ncbi:PEP-CTERM sorting domain-containing protein [Bythopirellula polymerisocia]|uniref:PEP-CTERM protein-sorting domain-containing protein n=1 Tax=Bythopirellula polymerisocia TaxID=2528003 RepID=A0A5C6CR60_9BACT|nr:PEP-CTERM sorting domain-containing protein [Bythopirellula polymerisocia]TWU26027.1 hypothetical protein Pla144_32440 [Bythopirellula polymerisocia]